MSLLLDNEVELLLENFATSRGERSFTEEEATKILRWASETRHANLMLEMLLDGAAEINLREDGEIVFRGIRRATLETSEVVQQRFLEPILRRRGRLKAKRGKDDLDQ